MKSIEKILVATDFSEYSEEACEYAITLARKFDASLTVLHVINEPVDLRGFYVPHITFEELEKEISEGAVKMLEKFCSENMADFTRYEKEVVAGVPYEEIVKLAVEKGVSMIIIGTHGRTGLDHIIFGSTAERVVRTSPCPVLTIRLAQSD